MRRKTYVGYDLGDGETITDYVTLEVGRLTTNTSFQDMTMPGIKKAGQAIPTMFAYNESGEIIFSQTIYFEPEAVRNIVINFKRRPSDLLKNRTSMSVAEQIDLIKKSSSYPNASIWENGNSQEMLNFASDVITFTNAIFTNRKYADKLESAARDSDEIVFCVGHPTNWTELDIAIYERILKDSVLGLQEYEGKKSSIIMAAESRAAFLYAKDIEMFEKLPKDSSVLLIDVGSSTIDVTAMAALSNNHQYNSGSNYLGARSIDFMIRDWYLNKIKKQPADWLRYQNLVKNNPTIPNALALSCRRAKEEIYSADEGSRINFASFKPQKLWEKDLNQVIEETPVSKVLKEMINLDDQECALMGDKSWKQLFKEFLEEKKAEMTKRNIKVAYIILTGSASGMPFVPEIVQQVFPEASLHYDMDPSRTISKGLALVGPSNEKSKAFQNDLNHLVEEKLEKIIESNIPSLGKEMGTVISDILIPKMKQHIERWRNGYISTLNAMNEGIKSDCSEDKLTALLSNNSTYKKTIENWLKNKVGKDIAVELKGICDKYGVRDISIDDLNIMTMPKISITGVPLDPLEFMDTVAAVISIIAGIIAGASITTIMAVIIVVISLLSETLAALLFTLLVSMGLAGWTVIAGVVALTVAFIIAKGAGSVKSLFQEKVMGWDLPEIARNAMTDNKINESISKTNLPGRIEAAFGDTELKEKIVKQVSANLKGQIEKRAEDIKYAIESK